MPTALILPWGEVPHLAWPILGRMAKLMPHDRQRLYAHPIYWLETFVDPVRFKGHLLSRSELVGAGAHHGPWQECSQ